jgi:phosphoribosylaminoimidazole carboxylase
MLAAAASLLNVPVVILDTGEHTPAKQVVAPRTAALAHVDGAFADPDKIRALAARVDVLTVEIEHVDAGVLAEIQKAGTAAVHPAPATIAVIQDKFAQKEHLLAHGLPVATSIALESTPESVVAAAEKLGLPLMLKSRTLAYDGRGNFVLRDVADAQAAIDALGKRPLYAEKWVPFAKEVAVMVVRTTGGDVASYPVVETVHKDNICHIVFAPMRSTDPGLAARAHAVAEKAVHSLDGAGVFGVEMFLTEEGVSRAWLACPVFLIVWSTRQHPCQ